VTGYQVNGQKVLCEPFSRDAESTVPVHDAGWLLPPVPEPSAGDALPAISPAVLHFPAHLSRWARLWK